jgi:hypothetical protein
VEPTSGNACSTSNKGSNDDDQGRQLQTPLCVKQRRRQRGGENSAAGVLPSSRLGSSPAEGEAEWDRWHMPEAGTAEIFISRQTDGISGYLGSDAGL